MRTVTPAEVEHQHYCLPRPGEVEPRMERYSLPRYDQDGTTVTATAEVVRCCECGNRTVDGRLVRD